MKPAPLLSLLLWVWTLLVSAFILLPLVVLLAISFTADDFISLPWHGLSLRWYADMLGRADFLQAARVTVVLMLESAAAATVLGTLVAVALRVGASRDVPPSGSSSTRRCSFRSC